MAQELREQFAYYGSNGWYLNNNEWGRDAGQGEQCTYVDRIDDVGVGWHTLWSWTGGENNVKSFPYSGCELPTKRLVSNINSIYNKAEWNYHGDNIRANVTYDMFTAQDPNHEISSGEYEVMIWLGNLGGVHPIGSSQGTVRIGGFTWELFVGYNGTMKVFTYMAQQQIKTFTTDLRAFFDHLTITQGFPADKQHLITLQFGTEPFTGRNARFDVYYWMGNVS